MKRNSFIALLCAVFMIAGTTACEPEIIPTPDDTEQEENKDQNEEQPDDPAGEEEVNTGVVRSMALVSVNPNDDLQQATIQLSSEGLKVNNGTYNGTGVFLNLVIRTEKAEDGVVSIAEGEYAAADDTAEKLTWQVTGTEGETKTGSYVVAVIKGEPTEVELTEGTVTVTKNEAAPAEEGEEAAEEEYTIVVKSGKYDLTYVGTLEGLYTPPIEATFTGLGGWTDYGQYNVNMVGADLYTEGCTVAAKGWSYEYTGNGYHLKLEMYCAGGVIAEGTYEAQTVAQNEVVGEFKFKAGDATGGTELFEVVNGVATSVGKITDGTIVVEKDGDAYKVTINSTVLKATYTGKLEALPKEIETITVNKNGLTLTKVDDTENNPLQDGTPLSGVTLYYVELKDADNNTAAIFDFVVAEGSESIAGTYTVAAYPDEAGEAGNGWDYSTYDPTMIGGAIVYANGVGYPINAGSTITVTENNGEYEIVVDGTANITDMTTYATTVYNVKATLSTGSVPEPETPAGAVEFTQLLSCGTQAQYAQAVITLATDGVSSSFDMTTYQTVYTGTGKILNLTIHAEGFDTETPYIPVGTYNPDAESVNPFTWQITGGNEWMAWGTYCMDVVDGTATRIDLTEGTVEVTAVEDVYTLVFETGGEKYTYTGQLTGIVAPLQ